MNVSATTALTRRRRAVLAVSFLSCTFPLATAPAAQSADPEPTALVRSRLENCPNLRSSPSLEAPVLDCLAPKTRVAVLAFASGWSRVRLADGREGWTSSDSLEAPAATPAEGSELEATRAELARARTELEGARSRAAALQQALDNVRQQLEESTNESAELAERLEAAQASLDTADSARQADRRRLEELGGRSRGLAEELDATRSASAELRSRLDAASSELAQTRTESEAAEVSLEDCQRRISEISSELERSEAARRDLAGRLEAAARTEVDLREQLARLGGQVTDSTEIARAPGADSRLKVDVAEPLPSAGQSPRPPTEPAEIAAPASEVFDPAEIEFRVRSWARAWASQVVADYLSFYSPDFRPEDGSSREAWEGLRRARILQPSTIELTLDDVSVTRTGPDRASVTFEQSYSSDTYSDRVTKTLELERRDGEWWIVRETSG